MGFHRRLQRLWLHLRTPNFPADSSGPQSLQPLQHRCLPRVPRQLLACGPAGVVCDDATIAFGPVGRDGRAFGPVQSADGRVAARAHQHLHTVRMATARTGNPPFWAVKRRARPHKSGIKS